MLFLYETPGQSNDILSKDEYHDNDKHPKTFHLCLLPPSQFTFHFDYFGIHSVAVNNAVPVYHLFFCWYGTFLRLIGERMRQ